MRLFVLTALALLLGGGVPAMAVEPAAPMAAHRALYTLTLEQARASEVAGASGTMAYEVLDACDGWASRQRLEMTIINRDGQDIQMLSDYTTWESKDGLKMRFRMRQTTEQAVTSEVAGEASLERVGGPGTVHYSVPEDTTKDLPAGTLFPMAHTEAILAAARAGKKFITLPLFDGTSEKGGQDSSVAISSWGGPRPSKWPDLAKLPSGRVHVAFFDRGTSSQQPDYEVSMRYWDNGVADELDMDFGEFVMKGTLTQFAIVPPGC
ncbi:ATP/GTP-binding site motif A [Rhodovastum atsumiense]|uniref:Cell envelope integrity EipB family protein n=1 Tax=Rhodovastum atsumiense TaxID=504468 RepID=A0A5M6IVH4_9PROT|nr:cell envelope integrity EipB family protein [Rhodovastum atsumiense]KAA5612272.1 cell envelope integrity EipB family protein [Rhodovastum atsumiense]CAH2601598.1 ATP/GTP-binding site motif A [Rhodovastum atsumiense]